MDAAEEKRLLEDIRKGDDAATRRLFDECAPSLMSLTNRYIPDRDDAKDVLQTCFITIYKKVDRFEYQGPGSLMAWMKRIATNAAISWLRRQNRLSFIPLTDDLTEDTRDEEPNYTAWSQETIYAAIQSLPDGYRTVLNLYVFENRSHREIAGILGISEGTSASQLHRAKVKLWKILKKNAQ